MRVLFDTNIWIDIAARPTTFPESLALYMKLAAQSDAIYFPLCAYTTSHYILSKVLNAAAAQDFLKQLLQRKVRMAPFTEREVALAQSLAFTDHADACIVACALSVKADYVVTRNVRHFKASPISVLTPEGLMRKF